jgi:hypothetical protein
MRERSSYSVSSWHVELLSSGVELLLPMSDGIRSSIARRMYLKIEYMYVMLFCDFVVNE